MKRTPLLSLLLGLTLTLTTPARARRPPPAPPPPAPPAAPTMEERQATFGEVDELLREGKKKQAADGLLAIAGDPAHAVFHAEAYARLAALLDDLGFPYAGLVAVQKALTIDPEGVSSAIVLAMQLAQKTGDIELIESVFVTNVGVSVDDQTRGTIALLAARAAHRQGNNAVASAILKLVPASHPEYLEAKALEGVVLSMQGRHNDALAPLLTATAMAQEKRRDDERLRNVLALNTARAYFGAGNYPRAIESYLLVDRASPYWPEAQFERAWSHFRLEDVNGTLSQLQTLQAPYFESWYFPEADLLRIYSLFLMCKFPSAEQGINDFQARYTPIRDELRALGARPPQELYDALVKHVDGQATDLPRMITRKYEVEDRFLDNLQAVARAEAELKRIRGMQESPFAQTGATWLNERRDALVQSESERIRDKINSMADELDEMLYATETNKLDIMRLETRLYEAAARDGAMPDARATVRRDVRTGRGQLYWPWQGEYWADEVGYYKINTQPECPAGLRPGDG